jgi:hypothetical protein
MTATVRNCRLAEVDLFVRQFAERAARCRGDHPGDMEDTPAPPWTDPDNPDERQEVQ